LRTQTKHPLSRPKACKLHALPEVDRQRRFQTPPRRWLSEIRSDCGAILASVVPSVTTRHGAVDDDQECDEKIVDSGRPKPRGIPGAACTRRSSGSWRATTINSQSCHC
jgi:hypothetical protein